MRAGCESTLGQMSKLMDNPIGNVAMWFHQVDARIAPGSPFRPALPTRVLAANPEF